MLHQYEYASESDESSNDSLARVPYLFRAMLRHLTTTVGEKLGGLSGVTVYTV